MELLKDHPKYPFTIYHICLVANVGWTLGYIHFLHLFNKLYNQTETSLELYLHFRLKASVYMYKGISCLIGAYYELGA